METRGAAAADAASAHVPPTPDATRAREKTNGTDGRGRPRWFGLVWFVVAVRECDLAGSARLCGAGLVNNIVPRP
jgi:hypothetical protein